MTFFVHPGQLERPDCIAWWRDVADRGATVLVLKNLLWPGVPLETWLACPAGGTG